MANDRFRQFSIYRPLTIEIKRDGVIVDLSSIDGGDIKLTLRHVETRTLLVDHGGMEFVTDGSDGQVKREFTADELDADAEGVYEVQLEIIWEAGKSEDVEIDEDRIEIKAHYGTHPS